MKVALIAGGQPRFTPSFITLMNQLQGFESADIYMTLWKSSWAETESEARSKIEKILLPRYTLAKVQVVEEPEWKSKMPPSPYPLPDPNPENISWWFKRGYQQFISLSMTFDIIDKPYDAYIRFRLDGQLHDVLDISNINLPDDVIFPSNVNVGFDDFPINDHFAIGNYDAMKFYCDFGKNYPSLVPVADPNWFNDGCNRADLWSWSTEHVIGTYMKMNNRKKYVGNFQHTINVGGRSKFTDKHYHHGVLPDPSE